MTAPGVWRDVVGQAEAVAVLDAAARPGPGDGPARSMTHAWLVTGPPGSGRSVAALAFAAALECERGGCGECRSCREVLAGSHPDVVRLRTESVTFRIEEVRDWIGIAQRRPAVGRRRVMLVEDADRMTERTSNVLLKAIEEPPEHTVWLLCAPSAEDVLVTIRSRCRHVTLRIPAPEAVAELLVRRDGADPATAALAARAAGGHIGVARRLALDPAARDRRTEVLRRVAGIRGVADAVVVAGRILEIAGEEARLATEDRAAAERQELLRALGAEGKRALPPALRAQLRQLEEDQKRRATRAQRDVLDRTLTDLISWYRDVLVLQLGHARAGGEPVSPLVNEYLRGELVDAAAAGDPVETLRRIDAIGLARTRLAGNVAPLLALEAMAVALVAGPGGETR